jgi:23S rRNA pseudouridine2457 synthase
LFRYFIVHKPVGYLSQFSGEPADLTLMQLVEQNQLVDFPSDIYPVGRLDKDSEGLLLLTNDNKLKNSLLDPKNEHFKTYWVQVEGAIKTTDIQRLIAGGIEIKHNGRVHRCLSAKAKLLTDVQIEERNPPIRYRANIPTSWI